MPNQNDFFESTRECLFEIPEEYRARRTVDAAEVEAALSILVCHWDHCNDEQGDSPLYRALGIAVDAVQGVYTGHPVVSTAHLEGGAKPTPAGGGEDAGQNSGA
jgi:hypothetical protein